MSDTSTHPYGKYAALLILGLLIVRVVSLIASPVQLHGDEAQYWSWAQDLDWGYFSKPPMIAWVIASTTALFGDAEWAVRLSSPILHAATATMLYLTGKYIWDSRTGFWTVLLYYLMPAVFLSVGIVSTDVPLLLCWAFALYGFVRFRDEQKWRWALLFGIAFGLGILAKYAMFFFIPALVGTLIIAPKYRKAILSIKGITALVITALILLPNILWNAANDFATVSHTAANSNLSGGIPFHPPKLLEFWFEQLGVFGPFTLILYIAAIIAAWRGKLSADAKWVSLFVLAPILIISVQALLSRANANWAVTSYIGGALLTAHYIVSRLRKPRLAQIGVGINVTLGLVVTFAALLPSFADAIGQANAFKRTRGWVQTTDAVREAALRGHDGKAYETIATDNRLVFYDLNYYGINDTKPLKMWLHTAHANNHAEATAPLPAMQEDPVLIVNYYDDYEGKFRDDFQRIERVGYIDIDLGGGKRRQLKLWAGYGYTPTTTR